MAEITPKDPDAKLPYSVDLSDWFTETGETSVSTTGGKEASATVAAGTVTATNVVAGVQSLTVDVSGGADGEEAEVVLTWYGDGDVYTDQISIFIRIQEQANRVK